MKKRADGRWLKVVTVNGKREYFYSSEPTERKAERDIARQMLEHKEKGRKGLLFNDVATEWEDKHYKHIEYSTSARYKTYTATAVDHFDGQYIKSIEAKDIESFLNKLAFERKSSKTIKDQLSVVRMIFRYAIINNYIDSDPTLYIVPPKGEKSVKRDVLSESEVLSVRQNVNKTFGRLAFFLLYTGLRKGEALALQSCCRKMSLPTNMYFKALAAV